MSSTTHDNFPDNFQTIHRHILENREGPVKPEVNCLLGAFPFLRFLKGESRGSGRSPYEGLRLLTDIASSTVIACVNFGRIFFLDKAEED